MFTRVQMLCLPPVFYAKLDWFSYIRKKLECLISEIIIWYQNFELNFCYQKFVRFCDIRKWFSDIRKSFSDITKSARISDIRKKGRFFYIRNSCIFWYQKLFFDIGNCFLISEIPIFWYQKIISDIRKSNFWYQKIIFWYQKIGIKVLCGVTYHSATALPTYIPIFERSFWNWNMGFWGCIAVPCKMASCNLCDKVLENINVYVHLLYRYKPWEKYWFIYFIFTYHEL